MQSFLLAIRIACVALTLALLTSGCAEEEDPCLSSPCNPAVMLEIVTADGEAVDTFRGEARFEGGTVAFGCAADAPLFAGDFLCASGGVSLTMGVIERVELSITSASGSFEGARMLEYVARIYEPWQEHPNRRAVWYAIEVIVLE